MRSLNPSLARAEELGRCLLQAHGYRGLGNPYATTGRRERARAELSATIALDRAMEMMCWLPRAEVALVEMEACRSRVAACWPMADQTAPGCRDPVTALCPPSSLAAQGYSSSSIASARLCASGLTYRQIYRSLRCPESSMA